MPGFMGLRGLEQKNLHDMERERREDGRQASLANMERRSQEKVQEILRDQEGDMSAYSGALNDVNQSDCDRIAAHYVERIMSSRVAVLSFDDNLLTVQGIFASVKFRHLPVVDEDGGIIGIISDRDFLRVASPFFGTVNEQNRDKEIMMRKVGTIMTRNPICANMQTTILEAVKLMNGRKISCLPIVKPGGSKLQGIVTWKDVVRAFCPKAFNAASDSARLKAGVTVNPQTSESARFRAKTAESARLMARKPEPPPPPAGGHGNQPPHASGERPPATSERISLHAPTLGQQQKLHSSNAGRSGSDLADAQNERMRAQQADHRQQE